MALTIRNNLAAIRAANQLNSIQKNLVTSLDKISSGRRVNRAADDPAGLSVASRMESDRRSLQQAIRNANDGVSLVQTAEGGLNEIYNVLVRMRELSVQASNETYNSSDRSQMNVEFNSLMNEIVRIASIANFNRQSLLQGGSSAFALQIGIHNTSADRIGLNLSSLSSTAGALGLSFLRSNGISTMTNAASAISALDGALSEVNTKRSYLGAIQNRLENAISQATSYSENLAASASQIIDVDYAEESANMTKYQIMQQAAIAALGQAKSIPQSIISLLS